MEDRRKELTNDVYTRVHKASSWQDPQKSVFSRRRFVCTIDLKSRHVMFRLLFDGLP